MSRNGELCFIARTICFVKAQNPFELVLRAFRSSIEPGSSFQPRKLARQESTENDHGPSPYEVRVADEIIEVAHAQRGR